MFYEPYYGERDQTLQNLRSLPFVTDVVIEGRDHEGSYICEWVRFRLKNRPDTLVIIYCDHQLSKATADTPLGSLVLKRIGPWEFHQEGEVRYASTGDLHPLVADFIKLGPEGDFQKEIPIEINSLGDLAKHYDDLVKLFAAWPTQAAPGHYKLNKPDYSETGSYFCKPA